MKPEQLYCGWLYQYSNLKCNLYQICHAGNKFQVIHFCYQQQLSIFAIMLLLKRFLVKLSCLFIYNNCSDYQYMHIECQQF